MFCLITAKVRNSTAIPTEPPTPPLSEIQNARIFRLHCLRRGRLGECWVQEDDGALQVQAQVHGASLPPCNAAPDSALNMQLSTEYWSL